MLFNAVFFLTLFSINMSSKIFSIVLLSLSANIYAAPASIPSKFHGLWATEEGCRKINIDGIDGPSAERVNLVILEKSQIVFTTNSCELKSVKKSNEKTFSGQFICGDDGESFKRAFEVSLNDAVKLSVKGYKELVDLSVCKLKKP